MARILAALALLVLSTAVASAEAPSLLHATRKAAFEHVKEDVVNAVTKRGFVIDYTAHIGAMLDRTAKDVGATRKVYDRAEAIQFCSATLSRKTMEADPANIVFCPYVISIYTLPADPGTVHIAYRRPQVAGPPASRAALKAVDDLLAAIVKEAAKAK
jgi:hypothetical protein